MGGFLHNSRKNYSHLLFLIKKIFISLQINQLSTPDTYLIFATYL